MQTQIRLLLLGQSDQALHYLLFHSHFLPKYLMVWLLHLSCVMRKPAFCICENKDANQLRSNCAADQLFCFPDIDIVQSLYFLNPKFLPSSHLLWLYSLVYVRPGRKPRRPVFSRHGSFKKDTFLQIIRKQRYKSITKTLKHFRYGPVKC